MCYLPQFALLCLTLVALSYDIRIQYCCGSLKDGKHKSINQMQLLKRKFNESKYVLTLTAQAVIHFMSLPMYYEMNPTFPALL